MSFFSKLIHAVLSHETGQKECRVMLILRTLNCNTIVSFTINILPLCNLTFMYLFYININFPFHREHSLSISLHYKDETDTAI